jgi:hypothetical protein
MEFTFVLIPPYLRSPNRYRKAAPLILRATNKSGSNKQSSAKASTSPANLFARTALALITMEIST